MKRIYKAINEGLNLIDFGNQKIQKSNKIKLDLKNFEFGQYVYYDPKLGYNNIKKGDKVAICICEDPELYIVINHPLYKQKKPWASEQSKLELQLVNDYENGWENTQNIRNNYKQTNNKQLAFNRLTGTIWSDMMLKNNEYIPSINEYEYIDAVIEKTTEDGIEMSEAIGMSVKYEYWSSSQYNHLVNGDYPYALTWMFYPMADQDAGYKSKDKYKALVLLNIDVNPK